MVSNNSWNTARMPSLSFTIFNTVPERIMSDALEEHWENMLKSLAWGGVETNLRFAEDMDAIAEETQE